MELSEILEKTKEIATSIAHQEAQEVDQNLKWTEKSIRAMQSAGLAGLVIPKKYGGLGQGIHGYVRVCEELGKYNPSAAISFGMHVVASAVLSAKPTDEHIEQYLIPICEGKHLTTLALSESGTGAEFYYPQSEMEIKGEDVILRGSKSFVTNGGHADSYVVSTKNPNESGDGQFSMFIIPSNTSGMKWEGDWNGFGMRGNHSIAMRMDDLKIPKKNLLGDEGDQIWYVFQVVGPYFLSAMAGAYLGLSDRCLEITIDHLKKRTHQHSQKTLAQNHVVQDQIADLWADVQKNRQYLYWSSLQFDKGGDDTSIPGVLMSKVISSETAVHIANRSLDMCGGMAYRENSELTRLLRDARAANVMSPTTQILKLWTGRCLLNVPIIE